MQTKLRLGFNGRSCALTLKNLVESRCSLACVLEGGVTELMLLLN